MTLCLTDGCRLGAGHDGACVRANGSVVLFPRDRAELDEAHYFLTAAGENVVAEITRRDYLRRLDGVVGILERADRVAADLQRAIADARHRLESDRCDACHDFAEVSRCECGNEYCCRCLPVHLASVVRSPELRVVHGGESS